MLKQSYFRIRPDVKLTTTSTGILKNAIGSDNEQMYNDLVMGFIREISRSSYRKFTHLTPAMKASKEVMTTEIASLPDLETNLPVPLLIVSQIVEIGTDGFPKRTIYFMSVDEARKKGNAGILYQDVIEEFMRMTDLVQSVRQTVAPMPIPEIQGLINLNGNG